MNRKIRLGCMVLLGASLLFVGVLTALHLEYPKDYSAGHPESAPRSGDVTAARSQLQAEHAVRLAKRSAQLGEIAPDAGVQAPAPNTAATDKRILFGDLHVHSTFSIDAFIFSLPLFGGEGTHPPADACDFARHCSSLDFFSINDHAESLTPERWTQTIDMIRECNAKAGDPKTPDMVAYVGWEWTQAGLTPENHWGHKNIIYENLGDDQLPRRPITSLPQGTMKRAKYSWLMTGLQALGPVGLDSFTEFFWLVNEMAAVPDCPLGVLSRDLPSNCRENASTPAALFRKLREWELDAIVIPHGLAWGLHAPVNSSLENQLTTAHHDPEKQLLLEVFSSHGNGERFSTHQSAKANDKGELICPERAAGFLPCCQRAGDIQRERCGDIPEAECEQLVQRAKRLAVEAGLHPEYVFPDTEVEEWLDCDQCRDCFKPVLTPRPKESAQYALALSKTKEGKQHRYRWGFIASSDNHTARPGTGYKQYARQYITDAEGIANETVSKGLQPWLRGTAENPDRAEPVVVEQQRNFKDLLGMERTGSYMYTGGLVAVHAAGRDRHNIWQSLKRREVYGTSGPRILLWFDVLNSPQGRQPMGAHLSMAESPEFEVRALGSFQQLPGCPDFTTSGFSGDKLDRLCRGECYHPSDTRHAITHIEVVRVRPQQTAKEEMSTLIEDPWKTFECPADQDGCVFRFKDPDFRDSARDAVYYVRALQAPTPAINGGNARAQRDDDGNITSVNLCHGDYRTDFADDCLVPVKERAWSSPIYLDQTVSSR
ncbi:MAG: DUF3604 domain-containing protein [Polyangiaceae bacterium]|nr:DUF3604 domain-containing protein [Polyangiaceae bacterium]